MTLVAASRKACQNDSE